MLHYHRLMQAAQQEGLVSNAEASRLERDLAAARTAAMANGVGVKSRLQALQIAYVHSLSTSSFEHCIFHVLRCQRKRLG